MRYDLKHPSREPVVWSSLVKDGLVIAIGGLTVFGVFTPTEEQYAWLLTAFGFVSMVVAFILREVVYSASYVEEEILDAETVLHDGRDYEPDPTAVDVNPEDFGPADGEE